RTELIPLAALVTPNLDEAAMLIGESISDVRGMERAAIALSGPGRASAALVKGGHLDPAGDRVIDVLHADGELRRFERPRVHTRELHGTGCTLSAAITALLASGESLGD